MPKTTYIACPTCKKFTNKVKVNCDVCKAVMPKIEANDPRYYVTSFRAGFYEHIDLDPIYCGSRKQLRDETTARGQTSHYIH